jgi:cbb3-type cytochrome oxidase cytochrome c subunit
LKTWRLGEKLFVVAAVAIFLVAAGIYAYEQFLPGPTTRYPTRLTPQAMEGQQVFLSMKCDECHMVYNTLGDIDQALGGGPNLGGIGGRHSQAWIYAYLQGTGRQIPGMGYPLRHLTPVQIKALAVFLTTLKAPANSHDQFQMPNT